MNWKKVPSEAGESSSLHAIGARIRDERTRLKLGVVEFAHFGGVSDRSQRNYENGERVPDAEYLSRIQTMTDVDVEYILSGERSVYQNYADEIERQCDTVEHVVLMLEGALSTRGAALDASQKAKCARWLYRAAKHGAPITETVIDELLSMLRP